MHPKPARQIEENNGRNRFSIIYYLLIKKKKM